MIDEPTEPVESASIQDSEPASTQDFDPASTQDSDPEQLRCLLIQFGEEHGDSAYRTLATQVEQCATRIADAGHVDSCYRAIAVLAEHALTSGERTGTQQRYAEAALNKLASGERLADLIRRAARSATETDLRAAQILVQLGSRAVPSLMEAIEAETEREYVDRLTSLFLVLDDSAIPALERSITEGSPARRRLAVRLAAKIAHPSLVSALIGLLSSESSELRRLATHALVQIGDRNTVTSLIEELKSGVPGVPEAAASCLGGIGDQRAAAALRSHLDRACRRGHFSLAQHLIGALVLLQDPESVPKLVSILDRSVLLRRRMFRALRISALDALDQMPGSEARRAVYRTLHAKDRSLRERAEQLIDRREEAMDRPADAE